MDYFGKAQLRELLSPQPEPAVSIYLPTERVAGGWETNRLRFKAALGKAQDLIVDDYDGGAPVVQGLRPLIDDQDFWLYQSDGLALFASPAVVRSYRLPVAFEEIVVVGPTFHTRPVVELLQTPDYYWLLAVSQNEVRLWQGTPNGLTPVDLTGVPTSLKEAMGTDVEPDRLSFHSPSPRGVAPIFHGYGVGKDDSKAELKRFFRAVDAGLRELLADDLAPVILAAVDYYHPIYQSITHLDNLADEGIQGNVSSWSEGRLHDAARPIVQRSVERKLERARELWESAFKQRKVESDLVATGRLAVSGRIRLLMTERGRRLWGRFDRATGEIELIQEAGDDPGEHAVELLDELAEIVILHRGNALVLPAERMPTETGVAAVLR